MATPRITYQNLSTYGTISASFAASASTSLDNLKSYESTDVWKSSVTTANQLISIDMGSAVTFTDVIIDNCNFDSVNCTFVSLIAADDANLSVNAVSMITNMQDSGSLFHATFAGAPVTKQYWGIKFYGTQAVAPQIGNIFLSNDLVFDTPYQWNYKTEDKEYVTTQKTTLSGRYVSKQNYKGRIVNELNFELQSNTFATNFKTFFSTIRGKLYPFYFVEGTTIRYMNCIDDYVPIEVTRYNQNKVALKLKTHESNY